jgi:zinc transport system ATP-binding protein
MALITCNNLSLAYEGAPVASGITFSVNEGDYLCVVGENGSGKSTLIKGLLGLISPAGGSLELGDGLKRTEIGYLPQQTDLQKDFPASVWEVVLSGRLNSRGMKPFFSRADRAAARENMQLLDIANLEKACFRELSGGQRQRVLLARALCATKKLLLLDEPVAGLDPIVAAEMYEVIARLNRESGVAVIMISHDIPAAKKYASHILHLHKTPLFYGTTAEYLKSELGRSFMGGDGQ